MLSSYLRFFEDETVKIKFFVANIWGTRERIARAMKINEKEIPEVFSKAMENPMECEEVKNPPFLENVTKSVISRSLVKRG